VLGRRPQIEERASPTKNENEGGGGGELEGGCPSSSEEKGG
jgi:hypothetical protein